MNFTYLDWLTLAFVFWTALATVYVAVDVVIKVWG